MPLNGTCCQLIDLFSWGQLVKKWKHLVCVFLQVIVAEDFRWIYRVDLHVTQGQGQLPWCLVTAPTQMVMLMLYAHFRTVDTIVWPWLLGNQIVSSTQRDTWWSDLGENLHGGKFLWLNWKYSIRILPFKVYKSS